MNDFASLRNLLLAIVFLTWGSSLTVQADLTDDLVGLYEFENNYLDSSGSLNLNHGTPVNNPGFILGKIGTGLSLDGVNDYVSFNPNSLSDFEFGSTNTGTDTDFSMSMWIRQDDFLSDPAVLSNKDWNSGTTTGINWAAKGNGVFDLNTKGNTGSRRDLDTAVNSSPLTVGAWNLVVMTVDRDGPTELYINGVNTGTIPFSSTGTFSSGLPWNVGQDGTGSYSVEFTGAVDEFAVWRRALSSSEASELWNGGAGIAISDQVVESTLKLIIDRQSGSMTIENNTATDQNLIGYQITSAAGAFDQAGWTPVAGRLDAAGNGSLDDDDNWIVGTAVNSVSDFIELSLGSGTLGAGETIELGIGTWARFYEETTDVEFQYADGVGNDLISGAVEFIGGVGGPQGFDYGDLNFDGQINRQDWERLRLGFGNSLTGLSEAQRYRLSDINNDGEHTLDDILAFRIQYDAVNGVGSFQAMITGVPEPSTIGLLLLAGAAGSLVRRRPEAVRWSAVFLILLTLGNSSEAASFFSESFDSVPLGPNVDEGVPGTQVWTNTPPNGWSIENSGVPNGGVTEWRGWAFTDPAWWAETAQDQGRSQFTKASGAIAVADPDEWDDTTPAPGLYNSFLQTPSFSVAGAAAGTMQLRFDSSWRPEDTQTASINISFDSGTPVEVLRWTSVAGDTDFKGDATNETVVIPINNPANASTMTIDFGMTDAGNDWWWAIDNLEVFTPLTLQVDVQSGEMKILADSAVAINGYEIFSPGGSHAPAGWLAGNLDAQNLGNQLPAPADFNSSGTVNATDLNTWNTAYGTTTAADVEPDGDSDGADFLAWQNQFGTSSDPISTWQTFLGTDRQLIESYLLGSSTFASDVTLGLGYDTTKDMRDLQFTYLTDSLEEMTGLVQYINTEATPSSTAIPEPAGSTLISLLLLITSGSLRLRHSE